MAYRPQIRWHLEDFSVVGEPGARYAARLVRDEAKRIIRAEGRVRTGALVESIAYRRTGKSRYQVGSPLRYAGWQHEGVRGPIRPRRASVLVFRPKGSRVVLFRPRVSGFPGIQFLRRAVEHVSRRM